MFPASARQNAVAPNPKTLAGYNKTKPVPSFMQQCGVGGIAVKSGRVWAAAIGVALGIFVSGSAGAVIVDIEYTGVVLGAFNPILGVFVSSPYFGQSYTANYVFDLSVANPGGFQINDPINNYVFGGTPNPGSNGPAISASITIGAFTFTVPLANSQFSELFAYHNGNVASQYHSASNFDNTVYLINEIYINGPSLIPATIDQAFSFSLGGDTSAYNGTYCDGSVCYELEANTVTETLATSETPLPATLPLFATGLGASGLLARRRKRKAIATAR